MSEVYHKYVPFLTFLGKYIIRRRRSLYPRQMQGRSGVLKWSCIYGIQRRPEQMIKSTIFFLP